MRPPLFHTRVGGWSSPFLQDLPPVLGCSSGADPCREICCLPRISRKERRELGGPGQGPAAPVTWGKCLPPQACALLC